jgi:hypothetical protein
VAPRVNIQSIIRRLVRRYSLTPGPTEEAMILYPAVIPVQDMGEVLRIAKIVFETSALVVGGNTTVATVPAGKRWWVHAYDIQRASGDRTITNVNVNDPTASGNLILDSFSATGSHQLRLEYPIIMDENWYLKVGLGGGTTDGDWTAALLVEEEDMW